MKIAITGGAGFIASQIADAYLERGHEVLIIDDLSTGSRNNLPAQATFAECDIGSKAARDALLAFKPDVLNHHAAQMDVRKSVADPLFDARVNVLGLLNLLEACREAGTRRVLFASSGGAAYGEQDRYPADESHATRPASPYGVAKVAGELYLNSFAHMYGWSALSLRYANVYGPRQNAHGEAGVVAIFSLKCLAGERCTVFGDGLQTRDFVYVGDVVAANVAGLERPHVQGAVNIGTGVETDINQVQFLVAKAAGRGDGPLYQEGKRGEARRSVLDAAHAKKVLGWQPQVPLEQGIERTVDFFRQRSTAK
ncbi:MAG: NAD-dependent epimerase/dehydratase family protein [Myxococcaceae bacterium]|nr:NAD-dependent epimerase/dehydratase family protein [Myxococcaceae bacterium]